MDGIVGIFIVWAVIGLIGSALKKAKKTAADADKKPADEPAPAAKPHKASVWEQIEMMGMLPKDDEPAEEQPAAAVEGSKQAWGSMTDYVPLAASQEGAMSPGSIAGAAGEGSFAAAPFADGGERNIKSVTRVSSRDMKNAVIMAEILGRPVAMRRKNGAFQKRGCEV